jgi:hypothetical protein
MCDHDQQDAFVGRWGVVVPSEEKADAKAAVAAYAERVNRRAKGHRTNGHGK